MKKKLILILVLVICCGPSEDELQQRIDEAVNNATSSTTTLSSTTSSSSTTTLREKVEWKPSTLEITCPSSNSLSYGSEFRVSYEIKFGDNPLKITLKYYSLGEQKEIVDVLTPQNYQIINWEKGKTFSEFIYDLESLSRDYESFYFSVEIKDSSGSLSKDCNIQNSTDISSLPPIVELSCPKNIKQGETLKVDYKILSRLYDVSYVDFTFIQDGNEDLLTFSDPNGLPKKEFRITTGNLTSNVLIKEYDFNISVQAVIYDSRGEFHKTSCGLKALTDDNNITTTTVPQSTTTTTLPQSTTTTTVPQSTTTTVPPNIYPDTPSSSSWYRFSGSGDDIVDISSIGSEVMIAVIEHSGSSNFIITALGSGLEYQDLKINEIGSYKGVVSINFNNQRNFYLEINADGSWEVVIKPIASAENFDSNSISGSGDSIVEAYELKSKDQLNFTHSGSSNFIVTQYRCNGLYNSYVINEIGSYDGKVVTDSGTCYLEIMADGNWSITK